MFKQLWIRSQATGLLPQHELSGNLEQVTSPLWVCLLICKRKVLAQVVAEVPCLVKERPSGLGPGPGPPPPPLASPPQASQAPGTKTRNKQTSRGNFPLPWKQSWGGLERRVESQACQVEMGQTGRGMTRTIISLPCREHLRTPRPDVLILRSPRCDTIPTKSMSLLLASLPGVDPACSGRASVSKHISSYGRAPAASALSAEPVLQQHTQCLGTCQAPAAQPPPAQPAAHPPPSESPTSFLYHHLSCSMEEPVIDLGLFLQVATR